MTLSEAARRDVGKQETAGGFGFEDPALESALRDSGWKPGCSWNTWILEKWLMESMPKRALDFNGYFVENAMATFRNLKNAGMEISPIPVVDSIVFWQRMDDGNPIWLGQTGVVSNVISGTEFLAIIGSINIQEKAYTIRRHVHDGLKVIGFVTP